MNLSHLLATCAHRINYLEASTLIFACCSRLSIDEHFIIEWPTWDRNISIRQFIDGIYLTSMLFNIDIDLRSITRVFVILATKILRCWPAISVFVSRQSINVLRIIIINRHCLAFSGSVYLIVWPILSNASQHLASFGYHLLATAFILELWDLILFILAVDDLAEDAAEFLNELYQVIR